MVDDGVRHDLIEGESCRDITAKAVHGRVAARLIRLIDGHAQAQQPGDVFTEAGFAAARKPDIVQWARCRVCRRVDCRKTISMSISTAHRILPWRSSRPTITRRILRELIDLYFVAGARLVWVVYPMFRTIEVYRPDNSATVLRADDLLDGEAISAGL